MIFQFRHLLIPYIEVKPDMKELEHQARLERKLLESEMLHMLASRARLLQEPQRVYSYRNLN